MRLVFRVSALSLILSLLVAAPVAAQEGFSFRVADTGTAADAFFTTCTPDTPEPGLETCVFTSVSVIEGTRLTKSEFPRPERTGSQACVLTQTYIHGPDTFENVFMADGCTDTFSFTVSEDLSTAHLTATVPLTELVCTPTPTGETCETVGDPFNVTVDVTWTALEPAQTVRDRGVFHFLDPFSGLWCKQTFSRSGLAAFGTATGSLDGTDLGTAEFAEIFSGRMSFANSCR